MDTSRLRAALAALLVPAGLAAQAPGPDASTLDAARELVRAGARHAGAARVEIELGTLDPRLRLAPCEQVTPYLPPGTRLWGRARIGLRCTRGASPWNVYLPVTVKVFATALVAAQPLPAGATLAEADVARAEVDVAAGASAALLDPLQAAGRTLARAVNAGQALREADLRPRQWFAAGDTVRVVTQGEGFRATAEAQALNAGIEGQPARVRMPSGRILTGRPAGEHRVELAP